MTDEQGKATELAAMDFASTATLHTANVSVSFHGDGRVTGSHSLTPWQASIEILHLGKAMTSTEGQPSPNNKAMRKRRNA
mgnify:CR=1 FL=1